MVAVRRILRCNILFVLLLAFVVEMAVPLMAADKKTETKVVRVGWYESSYNQIGENGIRSGYAYEYQIKMAAYNGWTYEYVSGSWTDLLHMLEEGKIDLMSDVSYTPEREEHMSFASLPMGTEEYFIFALPGNYELFVSTPSAVNGKKIGVNADSIQAGYLNDWCEKNEVQADIVLLNGSEEDSLQKLESGELDAYVAVDSFVSSSRAMPVYKIGSSDYYFTVPKDRPDLLDDLNYAMGRIQDEDRYYNSKLFDRYVRGNGANAFLLQEETEWLEEHKVIRVAYQDNYLAFCAADKSSGELKGVLKDFLDSAAGCIPNAHLQFEAVAFSTSEAAMAALQNGEVDCVFPANLSSFEAEAAGIIMTPALINTESYAVVRMSDPNIFDKDRVIAAVNEGNPNYEAYLAKNFPAWDKAYFSNTAECLKAVAAGNADCLIISNFRYNNIARMCTKYHLTTFSLGVQMDYCFAVKKGQTELYSILAKTASLVPSSAIDAALSRYITEDAKLTVKDFLIDNLNVVLAIAGVIIAVILALLVQNIRAVRIARRLIRATENDDLTGLYNRKYFFQYANSMHQEQPETPMDAIVLNIEQFHSVNAVHGREFGDEILRGLGNEIKAIAKEAKGIAGRYEGDRFDIYCRHMEEYHTIFNRLQAKLDAMAPNANIRLRMGAMPWRKELEPVQLFDMANTACSMVRGNYKEHLIVYDDLVSEKEKYEQRLMRDLPRALENKEFQVYFQPKYDIQTEPPKLASTEALVRWKHSELGMISPGDFIPLFEKNGQISLLDKYVWTEAAKQVAIWREKYGVTIPVSVNLSRIDVFDPMLEETLNEILTSNGLEHNALKLEVTESAYTENGDHVINVVGRLRDKGFEVEMDDFGSGYSSLNMLSSMPIDVLKMDRAFIQNIEKNEKDQQLVGLILDIAKNLKVLAIAEGVETESQLHMLKDLGCALVQGYYFSRPLSAEDFEMRYLAGSDGKKEG